MPRRQLPLHFHALRVDPATPLSERTAELLHRDLQRWTRRYIRPVARLISVTAVWVIVALKRLLPFQFSWHSMLDRLSVWFLRRCVSREGGELLLRHFIVETLLIRFVARNSGFEDIPEPDLMPTTFKDLMGHAVIQHDVNMYRLIIDTGEKLRASGRVKCDKRAGLDCSMLDVPAITPDDEYCRFINLDLGTALYFMNIPFALLTSEDVYEQAVNSFQLDDPLMAHLADITGDSLFRAWGARQSLSWLEINRDVPRALYMHAVVHEYAHTHLCRLAAQSHRSTGSPV
ncbi:MAG: hypothetical protein DMF51_04935 [Acidobacteria bacterium]|nr:MAG: hypothetical protein DMF51_04935 [Acidobacteriota bacterium]